MILEATHGVELVYLLDVNVFLSPFFKTATDKRIRQFLTQSVVNFVKYWSVNFIITFSLIYFTTL